MGPLGIPWDPVQTMGTAGTRGTPFYPWDPRTSVGPYTIHRDTHGTLTYPGGCQVPVGPQATHGASGHRTETQGALEAGRRGRFWGENSGFWGKIPPG